MERRLAARFHSRERAQNAGPDGVSVYKHAPPQAGGGTPRGGGSAPSSGVWQPLAPAALLARRWQRALGPQPRGVFGQGVDQGADGGGIGLDVDPQAELGGGLGGLGADAGDDRPRVRLAGDADGVFQ